MKTINNNTGISVIGLGSMGSALASTLINKGFQLTVWNRDENKARTLIELGAQMADSVESAFAANPVTIMCVSNYEAAHSIMAQVRTYDKWAGKTFIHLSSGTPKEARDMELFFSSKGAEYLDGAILAWPSQIGGEETTILISGEQVVFEKVAPIMKVLAGNLTYMGREIASASSLFSAVLAYLAGEWIGFCHGALICEAEGIDVEVFGGIMHKLSSILGAELAHMGKVIRHDDYYNPESTIKTSGSDIAKLVQHAREAGINSDLTTFAAGLFKKAIDAGHGEEEHAAIIKVMRNI